MTWNSCKFLNVIYLTKEKTKWVLKVEGLLKFQSTIGKSFWNSCVFSVDSYKKEKSVQSLSCVWFFAWNMVNKMIFYKFIWCYYSLRIFPSSAFQYQTMQGHTFMCILPFAIPVTFLFYDLHFLDNFVSNIGLFAILQGIFKLHFLYPTMSSPHKPSIFYPVPLLVQFSL